MKSNLLKNKLLQLRITEAEKLIKGLDEKIRGQEEE